MSTSMADILGRTPVEVTGTDEEIVMRFSDGSQARWHHERDCCEIVTIEDVSGDWSDLLGQPLLVAEERTQDDPDACESGTWTFYAFRGIGGSVDVRWYGCSNGYYSESVDFEFTPGPRPT